MANLYYLCYRMKIYCIIKKPYSTWRRIGCLGRQVNTRACLLLNFVSMWDNLIWWNVNNNIFTSNSTRSIRLKTNT